MGEDWALELPHLPLHVKLPLKGQFLQLSGILMRSKELSSQPVSSPYEPVGKKTQPATKLVHSSHLSLMVTNWLR